MQNGTCAAILGVALACCAVVALGVGSDDNCTGGERHDPGTPSNFFYYNCEGTQDEMGTWTQLFRAPSLPWRWRRICFMMGWTDSSFATRNFTPLVTFHSAVLNATRGMVAPGALLRAVETVPVAVGNTKNRTTAGTFHSVDVDFVARDQFTFIGVSATSCYGFGLAMGCNRMAGDGLVYSSISSDPMMCCSPICDMNLRVFSIFLRAEGEPHATSATDDLVSWTCNRSRYDDGSTCDCGCGLEDPDCFRSAERSSPDCNASAGEICVQGLCVTHRWNTSVPGCDLSQIANNGMCNCGCGGTFVDPDCRNPLNPIAPGCCSHMAAPKCVVGVSSSTCVDTWGCSKDKFGDGRICDCYCAIPDPDCSNASLPSVCGQGMTCKEDRCVPLNWSCSPALFSDTSTCDCLCGAYDPDCDSSLSAVGCSNSSECSYDSTCAGTPKCGNKRVDVSRPDEQCDGGPHCTAACKCVQGYHPVFPRRGYCVPQCGDAVFTADEECEAGSAFCNETLCKCLPGHAVLAPNVCAGCGNSVIESDTEECDRGPRCSNASCTCESGYVPTVPRSRGCVLPVTSSHDLSTAAASSNDEDQGSLTVILLGVTIGVMTLAVVASAGFVSLWCWHNRSRIDRPHRHMIHESQAPSMIGFGLQQLSPLRSSGSSVPTTSSGTQSPFVTKFSSDFQYSGTSCTSITDFTSPAQTCEKI